VYESQAMRLYRKYIFLLLIIISGCATIDSFDSRALTRFDPILQNDKYEIWKYEAFVPAHGGSYGMGDLGDATRIRWLQEHLRMNGLSPISYEIIETKTSVAGQGFGGTSHRVYYVVKAIKENVRMK
jgi:hypothetical protein